MTRIVFGQRKQNKNLELVGGTRAASRPEFNPKLEGLDKASLSVGPQLGRSVVAGGSTPRRTRNTGSGRVTCPVLCGTKLLGPKKNRLVPRRQPGPRASGTKIRGDPSSLLQVLADGGDVVQGACHVELTVLDFPDNGHLLITGLLLNQLAVLQGHL